MMGVFFPIALTPLEIIPRYSLRARSPSLRGRCPSLRAGRLSEPEAGAEPGPAAAAGLDFRIIPPACR